MEICKKTEAQKETTLSKSQVLSIRTATVNVI